MMELEDLMEEIRICLQKADNIGAHLVSARLSQAIDDAKQILMKFDNIDQE